MNQLAIDEPTDEHVIGVGIVGANAHRGWAAEAHVPALRELPEYELRAVATTRRESAAESAAAFGASLAFSDPAELIHRPEIDLVVVSVRTPAHADLVRTAIEAGKAVYCEWPLARDLAEASGLLEQARAAAVRTVIGLQGRRSPVIEYVRDLVRDGFLGEVLSTTLVASWLPGDSSDEASAFMADESNGTNVLTVPLGHAVDALCFCLGEWQDMSAVLETRRPTLTVQGGGRQLHKTSPDQVVLAGRLAGGVIAAVHYRSGLESDDNAIWRIDGSKCSILVTAPYLHHAGMHGTAAQLLLRGQPPQELTVPARYWSGPAALAGTTAYNVARLYQALACDLRDGTHSVADFSAGLKRHQMIDTIQAAAESDHSSALTRGQV